MNWKEGYEYARTTTPRPANTKEIQDLSNYLYELENSSEDEALGSIHEHALTYTAVFDEYMTGSPGYVGKLMLVCYDGGPEMYECFIWREGKMVKVNSEFTQAAKA